MTGAAFYMLRLLDLDAGEILQRPRSSHADSPLQPCQRLRSLNRFGVGLSCIIALLENPTVTQLTEVMYPNKVLGTKGKTATTSQTFHLRSED